MHLSWQVLVLGFYVYLQGPTLCLFHDFGMYLRQIIMYLRQTVYTMITSTFGPVSVTISDFQGRSANLKWNQKVVFLGMFISCSDQILYHLCMYLNYVWK